MSNESKSHPVTALFTSRRIAPLVMHIFCNGDRVTLDVERLAEALERLGYTERRVVVAVNETFVAKEEWPSYRVRAGDRLDVLSAIEGG